MITRMPPRPIPPGCLRRCVLVLPSSASCRLVASVVLPRFGRCHASGKARCSVAGAAQTWDRVRTGMRTDPSEPQGETWTNGSGHRRLCRPSVWTMSDERTFPVTLMRAGPGLPYFEVGAYRYTAEWLPVGRRSDHHHEAVGDGARPGRAASRLRDPGGADRRNADPGDRGEGRPRRVDRRAHRRRRSRTSAGRSASPRPIRSRILAVSMRRAAFIAAMAALAWAGIAGGAPTPADRPTPQVAIFYYAWYGTPSLGRRVGALGPGRERSRRRRSARTSTPPAGRTRPGRPSVVRAQMREIAATGVDTVIVSWWGPGSVEDARLPSVVAARPVRRACMSRSTSSPGPAGRPQASPTRSAASPRSASATRTSTTRRASPDEDWRSALAGLTGVRVFANTPLAGKALKGGFQGIYTYDVLVYDGSSFGADVRERTAGRASSARRRSARASTRRRATGDPRVRDRNDGRWYDHMWQAAVRASPDLVTITSYNEWHEGTQIEPARAVERALRSATTAPGASTGDAHSGRTSIGRRTGSAGCVALWRRRSGRARRLQERQ